MNSCLHCSGRYNIAYSIIFLCCLFVGKNFLSTTTTQHPVSETSSNIPVAVIILSITNGISLMVITVLCGIITYPIRRKKNTNRGGIYEIPKEVKPESFNMTQSSVYGIHENRK